MFRAVTVIRVNEKDRTESEKLGDQIHALLVSSEEETKMLPEVEATIPEISENLNKARLTGNFKEAHDLSIKLAQASQARGNLIMAKAVKMTRLESQLSQISKPYRALYLRGLSNILTQASSQLTLTAEKTETRPLNRMDTIRLYKVTSNFVSISTFCDRVANALNEIRGNNRATVGQLENIYMSIISDLPEEFETKTTEDVSQDRVNGMKQIVSETEKDSRDALETETISFQEAKELSAWHTLKQKIDSVQSLAIKQFK
jgi:hypothetical protein